MNNKITAGKAEIIVEHEFGKENFVELYAEVVASKISKALSAEKNEAAAAANECGQLPPESAE